MLIHLSNSNGVSNIMRFTFLYAEAKVLLKLNAYIDHDISTST